MIPKLLHLYGPLYINSYGLCIALGLLVVMRLAQNYRAKQNFLTTDQFTSLLLYSICGALAGARILYLVTNWGQLNSPLEALAIWHGGGSVLGSIIGVLCIIPWFAHKEQLSSLVVLDFAARYALLLQSISRIGCFFAGCCYGKATNCFLGVTYWHSESMAPLFVKVHPTQLYSALLLFLLFLIFMRVERRLEKSGQRACLYVMLASIERFFIDIFRGDQEFFGHTSYNVFSINQWIALVLFCASVSFLAIRTAGHACPKDA